MAGNILWQSGPVINFGAQPSGQGATLFDTERVQLSGDIYNDGASGGPCLYGKFTWIGGPSASLGDNANEGRTIDLYLLPFFSGGEVPTASTSGLPAHLYRGSFVMQTSGGGTARFDMAIEGVPLMPVRYRAWIENNLGQLLVSGWSLFFEGFNEAYT